MTDDEFAPWIILEDANGRERDFPRPWLVFDPIDGSIIIADDYETTNDPTARDFILHKNDALKLAAALLNYAMHGATSGAGCSSQHDIENALEQHKEKYG